MPKGSSICTPISSTPSRRKAISTAAGTITQWHALQRVKGRKASQMTRNLDVCLRLRHHKRTHMQHIISSWWGSHCSNSLTNSNASFLLGNRWASCSQHCQAALSAEVHIGSAIGSANQVAKRNYTHQHWERDMKREGEHLAEGKRKGKG